MDVDGIIGPYRSIPDPLGFGSSFIHENSHLSEFTPKLHTDLYAAVSLHNPLLLLPEHTEHLLGCCHRFAAFRSVIHIIGMHAELAPTARPGAGWLGSIGPQ